jgi:hypothetical protein
MLQSAQLLTFLVYAPPPRALPASLRVSQAMMPASRWKPSWPSPATLPAKTQQQPTATHCCMTHVTSSSLRQPSRQQLSRAGAHPHPCSPFPSAAGYPRQQAAQPMARQGPHHCPPLLLAQLAGTGRPQQDSQQLGAGQQQQQQHFQLRPVLRAHGAGARH